MIIDDLAKIVSFLWDDQASIEKNNFSSASFTLGQAYSFTCAMCQKIAIDIQNEGCAEGQNDAYIEDLKKEILERETK